jgi:endonuclease/exonuclease/phosphatase family metal-dependent hydrolase
VKIASFNVENMFRRAVVLNQDNDKQAKPILEAYAEMTELLQRETYSAGDKKRILQLLEALELLSWKEKEGVKRPSFSEDSKWVWLRKVRGTLVSISTKEGTIEVVANGRADWIGWLELKREAVNEQATRNTAAVIADMDPDIMVVVEAEDRQALVRFNENVLKLDQGQDKTFGHVMLIDGNDERGIDVGLFAKGDFPVVSMQSHVDDLGKNGEPLFSRDCAEYEFQIGKNKLLVLANHFKSKRFGSGTDSDTRRKAQAERVAAIYNERKEEGWKYIVVAGDLNDTPDSKPLAPLIKKTDLKDASELTGWVWGEREGTFGGSKKEKIDYLLLSPALQGKVKAGGVNRKGLWHGDRTRNPWELLPTLKDEEQAASDHAAIWVEVEL